MELIGPLPYEGHRLQQKTT